MKAGLTLLNVTVRPYNSKDDLEIITEIIKEAWDYYLQSTEISRVKELMEYYLADDTKKFWLAFEGDNLVGVGEATLRESFRCQGEEGRLEILYIRDSASNYYDVHSALMDAIFETLREEGVDFIRVDTTLENADVLFV